METVAELKRTQPGKEFIITWYVAPGVVKGEAKRKFKEAKSKEVVFLTDRGDASFLSVKASEFVPHKDGFGVILEGTFRDATPEEIATGQARNLIYFEKPVVWDRELKFEGLRYTELN